MPVNRHYENLSISEIPKEITDLIAQNPTNFIQTRDGKVYYKIPFPNHETMEVCGVHENGSYCTQILLDGNVCSEHGKLRKDEILYLC